VVLLPGCGCCFPCPRPCPSIRYVAIRFQLPAVSGNPIFSSLPLTIDATAWGGTTRSWTPPGILSTVSSPAIDETLVVDLFQEPGFSVAGTYGQITVFPLGGIYSCLVTYGFSHSVTLGTWPVFDSLAASNNFRYLRTLQEDVSVENNLFPLGAWDTTEFLWRDTYGWRSGNTIEPSMARTISRQPATFQECSSPDSWATVSDVASGTYPSVGGSYERPFLIAPGGNTNIVPYFDPGSPGFPNFSRPEFYQETFVSPLLWRRLLPDPVVTITVS